MLFRQDTTDSVIASLSTTVARLRSLKDRHSADGTYCRQLAKEYADKADTSDSESKRAGTIADKIGALLEP